MPPRGAKTTPTPDPVGELMVPVPASLLAQLKDVLFHAGVYHVNKDVANAALHMQVVEYRPLTKALVDAREAFLALGVDDDRSGATTVELALEQRRPLVFHSALLGAPGIQTILDYHSWAYVRVFCGSDWLRMLARQIAYKEDSPVYGKMTVATGAPAEEGIRTFLREEQWMAVQGQAPS